MHVYDDSSALHRPELPSFVFDHDEGKKSNTRAAFASFSSALQNYNFDYFVGFPSVLFCHSGRFISFDFSTPVVSVFLRRWFHELRGGKTSALLVVWMAFFFVTVFSLLKYDFSHSVFVTIFHWIAIPLPTSEVPRKYFNQTFGPHSLQSTKRIESAGRNSSSFWDDQTKAS